MDCPHKHLKLCELTDSTPLHVLLELSDRNHAGYQRIEGLKEGMQRHPATIQAGKREVKRLLREQAEAVIETLYLAGCDRGSIKPVELRIEKMENHETYVSTLAESAIQETLKVGVSPYKLVPFDINGIFEMVKYQPEILLLEDLPMECSDREDILMALGQGMGVVDLMNQHGVAFRKFSTLLRANENLLSEQLRHLLFEYWKSPSWSGRDVGPWRPVEMGRISYSFKIISKRPNNKEICLRVATAMETRSQALRRSFPVKLQDLDDSVPYDDDVAAAFCRLNGTNLAGVSHVSPSYSKLVRFACEENPSAVDHAKPCRGLFKLLQSKVFVLRAIHSGADAFKLLERSPEAVKNDREIFVEAAFSSPRFLRDLETKWNNGAQFVRKRKTFRATMVESLHSALVDASELFDRFHLMTDQGGEVKREVPFKFPSDFGEIKTAWIEDAKLRELLVEGFSIRSLSRYWSELPRLFRDDFYFVSTVARNSTINDYGFYSTVARDSTAIDYNFGSPFHRPFMILHCSFLDHMIESFPSLLSDEAVIRNFATNASGENQDKFFSQVSPCILSNKTLTLELLSHYGKLYEFLPRELRCDSEIARAALVGLSGINGVCCNRARPVPLEIQERYPDLVVEYLGMVEPQRFDLQEPINPELLARRDVVMALLSTGSLESLHASDVPESWRHDREILLASAATSASTFHSLCPPSRRQDKSFMQEAVRTNPQVWHDADKSIQCDYDVWLTYVLASGNRNLAEHFGLLQAVMVEEEDWYSSEDNDDDEEEEYGSFGRLRGSALEDQILRYAQFSRQICERLRDYETFRIVRLAIARPSSPPDHQRRSCLSLLHQGNETRDGYVRLIAEYLGVASESEFPALKRVLVDLTRWGY